MNVSLLIPLLLAPLQGGEPPPQNESSQDPADLAPDTAIPAEEPAEPKVDPYPGRFAEGMAELARLAEEGEIDRALEVADALLVPGRIARLRARLETSTSGLSEQVLGAFDGPLAWLGLEHRSSADRGEIHYAKGLALAHAGRIADADASLELARALAGPTRTRLDAVYDLGTLDLLLAEAVREEIPEIAGQSGAAPAPPPPAPPGPPGQAGAQEEAPDPLELARVAYSAARDHFVERLRADWRDENTRANVELVMRRLRELDDIERQREEQQQEQQEQEDQEQDQQEQDDGDPQESDEDQESEPSEEEQDEGSEDSEEPEEPEGPEEDESEPDSEEQNAAPEEELSEEHLTQEEMKRLLERLKELEEKGEEIRARLQGARRSQAKKDW